MSDIVVPESETAATTGPDAASIRRARLLNLPGLVLPFLANLGMKETAPSELRWFGVGAGTILTAAAWWEWRLGNLWAAAALAAVHAALVLAGLLNPRLPEVVGGAWLAFGKALGRWMAYPVFALLYYVAVTPTALLIRLLGKDPLRRGAPPQASYWVRREPGKKERFERQF